MRQRVQSETQLVREPAARTRQKKRPNLDRNETPRGQPAIALGPQREKLVDEQLLVLVFDR